MKKIMLTLLSAFILSFSGVNVLSIHAVRVGPGVDWTWGGNYTTTVWSQTRNLEGRVSAVRASVAKNGYIRRGEWKHLQSSAEARGLGHAEAWYNYR